MVTKNKSLKEVTSQKPLKKEEYKGVFPEIEIVISEKKDINYVSIGRKIRRILAGSKDKPVKYLDKSKVIVLTRFNYKFFIDNLWFKYCSWFNSKFNRIEEFDKYKEVLEDDKKES